MQKQKGKEEIQRESILTRKGNDIYSVQSKSKKGVVIYPTYEHKCSLIRWTLLWGGLICWLSSHHYQCYTFSKVVSNIVFCLRYKDLHFIYNLRFGYFTFRNHLWGYNKTQPTELDIELFNPFFLPDSLPVDWECRIHQQHLCRRVILPQRVPLDMTLNNLMMELS